MNQSLGAHFLYLFCHSASRHVALYKGLSEENVTAVKEIFDDIEWTVAVIEDLQSSVLSSTVLGICFSDVMVSQ